MWWRFGRAAGRSGRRFGAREKGRDASVAAERNASSSDPFRHGCAVPPPLDHQGEACDRRHQGEAWGRGNDSFIEGSFGLLWMKPSGDILY